jgi:rhodanese-related sulfurtransferase
METLIKELKASDVKMMMQNNEDVVLIDTLSKESFCERHIPGSISISLKDIVKQAEIVLPDKNQRIITYCKNPECQTSVKAAEQLTNLGYKNVTHYAGGLEDWEKEGNQLVKSGMNKYVEEC